ncbi:hypothetical protein DSECCO2_344360 [anaerobic digester metagenome]|jgi:hypothetical protein|nr:hypothetical protein [Methanomassiliicoccales archaeon]
MVKVKEAKKGDLLGMDGRPNVLGGPSFSYSALEMFMMAPDFAVLVAGDSGIVVYHEGKGGKSRVLLMVGGSATDLLRSAEGSARGAGTVKITLEVSPESPVLPDLESAGYRKAGDVANYFAKGRPALFLEKIL